MSLSSGLHGLQNYGLTRDDLKKRGLSAKSIERVYRSMYVYTVGGDTSTRSIHGLIGRTVSKWLKGLN